MVNLPYRESRFKIQIETTAQFNGNYVLATQNINSLFVILFKKSWYFGVKSKRSLRNDKSLHRYFKTL